MDSWGIDCSIESTPPRTRLLRVGEAVPARRRHPVRAELLFGLEGRHDLVPRPPTSWGLVCALRDRAEGRENQRRKDEHFDQRNNEDPPRMSLTAHGLV